MMHLWADLVFLCVSMGRFKYQKSKRKIKMGYAVTHVIIAIVLIDLYRDYIAKKKFSIWFVLIGGVAGLLPDLDLPIQWIANALIGETYYLHRVVTHSLFFVGVFLLLALPFYLHRCFLYRCGVWLAHAHCA
jgi:membrane-bound metal-dependent hydrolase YbcI (DUF457 family)